MTEFENHFYQVMTEILDLIGRTEEEALAKGRFHTLSRSEMHTLKTIGLYDSRTMGETAAALGVTQGTLTVQVDRLVRKGYVQRQRRAEDRRVVELSLTRSGKLAYRIHRKFVRNLVQSIIEPLRGQDKALLLNTMETIDDYLHRQYEKYHEREAEKK